jgi:hypothetical protein
MSNARIFISAMRDKGYWKFSGRTNRSCSNVQRMWIAFADLISACVTLVTLGNVTCWASITIGLQFAEKNFDKGKG